MVYILRSDGAYCSFDGMTLDQVTTMLTAQGLSFNVIDQATWQTAVNALSI
jgi:hypothetical protein